MNESVRGEDQRKVLGSMVARGRGVKPVKVGLGHRPAVIGKTEMTIFAEDDVI
jgi:hypothetical protein